MNRTPIACGSTIRLKHVNTKGYLHSHRDHASPLSRQQEVSCYDGQDSGTLVLEEDLLLLN